MTEYRLPYRTDGQEPVFRPYINPEPSEDDTTLLAITPLPSERVAAADPVQELRAEVSVDEARRVAGALGGAWAVVVEDMESKPDANGKVVLEGQAAYEVNARGIWRDSLGEVDSSDPDTGPTTDTEVRAVMRALPATLSSGAAPLLFVTGHESSESKAPTLDILSLGHATPPETYLTNRVVEKVANTLPAQAIVKRHRKDTGTLLAVAGKARRGLRRLARLKTT
ncbi:hypothetical protein EYC59_03915 [Candidatus Saccharibacteria bacterium]|nr:MAG: hypothetical protein EYC59_03915 [Candidatus Saccharibacteria bacterium]